MPNLKCFTAETGRTQRRSDGTISLKGIRFEIPSRYHHFQRLGVRAAFWDLSQVHEPLAFADTLRARRGQPAPAHEHGQ